MDKSFVFLFFLLLPTVLLAQSNSYGLLKFNIPANWQQQTKQKAITFSGNDAETNTPVEIRIFENEPAGIKPDSSFKMAWQQIMINYGNPAVPYAKKSYTSSGLHVATNQASPAGITEDNQKKFTQLIVFIVEKQMQAIQVITSNAADFKLLRPFIDDFIESVDTVEKRKD